MVNDFEDFLRAKADVPKTFVEQKLRLHSLYFPQNTLMQTDVYRPPHGPPLIFNRKSPLLILKFTGGQGMKNKDSYLLLMSLTVCLITAG